MWNFLLQHDALLKCLLFTYRVRSLITHWPARIMSIGFRSSFSTSTTMVRFNSVCTERLIALVSDLGLDILIRLTMLNIPAFIDNKRAASYFIEPHSERVIATHLLWRLTYSDNANQSAHFTDNEFICVHVKCC